MSYLRLRDYNLRIQGKELDQITGADTSVRTEAERFAEGIVIAHLKQRYDTTREFQDTTVYSYTATYNADALVEINFPGYDATKTYALHSLITQAGVGYICTAAIGTPEVFTPAHWTILGNQYDLFAAVVPKPWFDLNAYYKVGDQVFWKNKTYTCLVETKIPDHLSQMQFKSYDAIPYYNFFPDDPINGIANWGHGVVYSVPIGTLPTDTTYWALGDNRDVQCLYRTIDIAIYEMTPRITPQNIPKTRIDAYDNAMKWLLEVSHGDINTELPEVQPLQGSPVSWGSEVKRNNQW